MVVGRGMFLGEEKRVDAIAEIENQRALKTDKL